MGNGKKGRAEFGTPKWLSNKMRSKGLQKLRWYCQMCQKQCRDDNGFKCHMMSESHQRQLLLFGDNPGRFLHGYSQDFAKNFNAILRRQYNQKRVHANVVYQQYISDKTHVHMNATCWVTLTSYVKHLGRTGQCEIDETEKGWFITWVKKDPEEELREKRAAKKEKMAKDDEERIRDYVDAQIEKARLQAKLDQEFIATELERGGDEEMVKLNLAMKERSKVKAGIDVKNPLKDIKDAPVIVKKKEDNKRKIVALEEIMKEEIEKKRLKEQNDPAMENAWLTPNIIVKIKAKSLGDRFYNKKGRILEVIDDFTAMVELNDRSAKVKVDQDDLETVIPNVGRRVVILWGKYGGQEAQMVSINTKEFQAELKLENGKIRKFPYEQFSKTFVDTDEVRIVQCPKIIETVIID